MNRARPFDTERKGQAVELDVAEGALLDVPRPSALTPPSRREGVEITWAAEVAIARDQHRPLEGPWPCGIDCHVNLQPIVRTLSGSDEIKNGAPEVRARRKSGS